MPVAVQDLVPDLTEMLFGQVLTLFPKFVVFGHVWKGLLLFQSFRVSMIQMVSGSLRGGTTKPVSYTHLDVYKRQV